MKTMNSIKDHSQGYCVGFLHPGEIGTYLATVASNNGHKVAWASEGRSEQTKSRADKHNIIDKITVSELANSSDVIISICPPHGATLTAEQIAKSNFSGIYLEANAISPNRVKQLSHLLSSNNINTVDGAIFGPIRSQNRKPLLVLSGEHYKLISKIFSSDNLIVKVISDEVGKASALKMCDSSIRKISLSLLYLTLALAEKQGIMEDLNWLFTNRTPDMPINNSESIQRSKKAWRFRSEMLDIIETFKDDELTPNFALAASEVFAKIPKGIDPSLDEILRCLNL